MIDDDIKELRDTIDVCWSDQCASENTERGKDHAALDRIERLARLGAAVEAKTKRYRKAVTGNADYRSYGGNVDQLDLIRLNSRRDSSLDCSAEQCQPCWLFKYEPDGFGMRRLHECPLCGGIRSFCVSCFTDHHDGGWNACNHDPKDGAGPRKCPRFHPLCLEAHP